jgi:hypothetical protein
MNLENLEKYNYALDTIFDFLKQEKERSPVNQVHILYQPSLTDPYVISTDAWHHWHLFTHKRVIHPGKMLSKTMIHNLILDNNTGGEKINGATFVFDEKNKQLNVEYGVTHYRKESLDFTIPIDEDIYFEQATVSINAQSKSDPWINVKLHLKNGVRPDFADMERRMRNVIREQIAKALQTHKGRLDNCQFSTTIPFSFVKANKGIRVQFDFSLMTFSKHTTTVPLYKKRNKPNKDGKKQITAAVL